MNLEEENMRLRRDLEETEGNKEVEVELKEVKLQTEDIPQVP